MNAMEAEFASLEPLHWGMFDLTSRHSVWPASEYLDAKERRARALDELALLDADLIGWKDQPNQSRATADTLQTVLSPKGSSARESIEACPFSDFGRLP